jgi:phosphate-selective porin OprO/OprP
MRTIPSAVRTALVTTITAVGLTTSTLHAQAASQDDLNALREQIRQLDQKLRVLERTTEIKEETAAADAKKQTIVSANDKGFTITSGDKAYSLKFGALVQFDSRLFFDDGVANRNGFFLRRIRTPLSGTVGNIYDFTITPELGANAIASTTSTVGLIDAWFSARFDPAFGLKAGRFVSPVALEPGANRHFIESPFVNTLLPNRDIGIEAFGKVAADYVDYRVGVYNGTRDNTQAFSTDEADGDKKIAGRLTLAPLKSLKDSVWSKLSLGFGAGVGNQRGVGTIGGANGLQNIVTNGQQTLLSYRNATTGNGVIANGRQVQLSPTIEWYPGNPWSFVGEYVSEKQTFTRYTGAVANNTFDATSTAWRVSIGYVLTGEEATKTGVAPAAPFNFGNGTWGAFELVGRVSGIDLGNELFYTGAQGGGNLNKYTNATGAVAYGAGLNWYLNKNARLLFDVEKTDFTDGGSPAATGGTKADELYFFSRFQLNF